MEVTPGPEGVTAAREALVARMEGDGEPFALLPRPSRHVTAEYAAMVRDCVRPGEPVEDDDTALVAATSGSTGAPRGVVITRANLRAAVEASWGAVPDLRECDWVLALPVTSIGGFGAIVRALLAGTSLHVLPSVGGATPFRADDLAQLPIRPPFALSLVPTQLSDALASPRATAWLAQATAVLVGAAATPPALADRARQAGVRVITTYGMTETTGGCVYDGVPLPGVRVDLVDDGRVDVIGPQVAAGYRGDPSSPAFGGRGVERRFRTSDHGVWEAGRLRILGRIDDVVTVHGVNVALGAVESVIRSVIGVAEVAVVAIPHPRQGHRIVAFVVATDPASLTRIAPAVTEALGRPARPEVVAMDRIPLLPSGKIDRLALRARARGE